MVSRRFRMLTAVTCLGMLFVLLGGALVTNTESGRGCGDDWPLCHGKFIPAYTLESFIEYSHRLVTSIVGLFVLASFIGSILLYRRFRYREGVVHASGALFFTVLQALMGAAAVMWPQSAAVMALHFGLSIMAFAFTLLLWLWARRMNRGESLDKPAAAVPRSVLMLAIATIVYCYFVIYLGAYIRHTDAAGGCLGWPLCNGQIIPEWEGITRFVFAHRVAAFILFLVVGWLMILINRVCQTNAALRRSGVIAFALIVAQVLSGALLTATLTNEELFIFTNMLHNLIISAFFGVVADLAIRAWKWQEHRLNR
ncbi:COX15/CtaA family protein [Paenibacillus spongiae]|uniref:COX15/CtaA family protein n=1 Tax=Paenibacillus spongiae TaxID=2909671 RepID=A0ABY5SD90_9BACL|nr:COX15/CtaA family protein [Paenibacillus spongiae]UVI31729.1 COX15/CtaA family protein [Paenibacillus spongiae]